MIKKFNDLFEVNTTDTIGTAVLKGATKGYIQGVLAAGLGLGVLAIGILTISSDSESEETEEELKDELDKEPQDGITI